MSNDTAAGKGMGDEGAQELWAALDRARTEQTPRTLAHVEDALFRHYLPMARATALAQAADNPDPEGVCQAAEVGLARAILSWRHRDTTRFDRYARATITDQLRRHDLLTATRPRRSSPSRHYPQGLLPGRNRPGPDRAPISPGGHRDLSGTYPLPHKELP